MSMFMLFGGSSTGGGGPPPEPVFTIWNNADKASGVDVTNGGLSFDGDAGGTGFRSLRATVFKTSGKWISEHTFTASSAFNADYLLGAATAAAGLGAYIGADAYGIAFYGQGFYFPGPVAYGAATTVSSVITLLLDMDNKTFAVKINGTKYADIDISYITDPMSWAGTAYKPTANFVCNSNFGESAFTYPESGFGGMSA